MKMEFFNRSAILKVLKRNILILVVSSILIAAFFIMSIAFFNYDRIVESDSRKNMQLIRDIYIELQT